MTAPIEVRAPTDQTEGTRSQVLQWLKAVGDTVAENEPLLEIETDKVTVEVAAPASGVLQEILVPEQQEIGPGELLGRIVTDSPAEPIAAAARTPSASAKSDERGERGSAAGSHKTLDSEPTRGAESAGNLTSRGAGMAREHEPSPAVSRLLREYQLQAGDVRGSGPGGRITVQDVLACGRNAHGAAGATAAPEPASSRPGATQTAASGAAGMDEREPFASGRQVPHTAVRKRIAQHMVQSLLHTAPHVTTVFDVDMSATLAHRERYKDDFARRGANLTLTAYFVQAVVAAIQAVPEANSRWTETALQLFESMHIGIATAADSGLVVPVLHAAQSLDLFGIATGLQDLVAKARSGSLSPADVRGGTFTISNHGVSGSLLAAPIVINQPQSAILGVGKLEKRPVVVSNGGVDEVRIQPRCYVTLTIDHRVMDGHRANAFLQALVQRLQSPSL